MHHFWQPICQCVVCRPGSGAGGGWHPALDSGLDQSMAAESTLIYPKVRPPAAPASLRQSSASLRPEGKSSSPVCVPFCAQIPYKHADTACTGKISQGALISLAANTCAIKAQAYCCYAMLNLSVSELLTQSALRIDFQPLTAPALCEGCRKAVNMLAP